MKKIYSTEDRVLIQVLKSTFEDNGIVSYIKNEQPPLAGEIPPIVAIPEIWVMNDKDETLANNLLQQTLNDNMVPKKPWHCPFCKEHIEGIFDVCWKCGHSR